MKNIENYGQVVELQTKELQDTLGGTLWDKVKNWLGIDSEVKFGGGDFGVRKSE